MKEKLYRDMIMNSPFGYAFHKIICDDHGKPYDYEFIEINEGFEAYTGLKKEGVIGKRILQVFPEIKNQEVDWITYYGEIALHRKVADDHYELYSKPLQKWYRVYAYSPEKYYFLTIFTDITKEKNEIEEKKILISTLKNMIFEFDEGFEFQNVIVRDENLKFFKEKDMVGKHISEVYPEPRASFFSEGLNKARATGKTNTIYYDMEIDGKIEYFEARIDYLTILNKSRFLVSVEQVTERYELQKKLETSYQEMETFFSLSLDLFCIADTKGIILKINQAWIDLLGYHSDELCKRPFMDFIHPEDYQETIKKLEDYNGKNKIIDFSNRFRQKNGEYRYIEWRSILWKDKLYAAARDITEQKATQAEIERSNERYNHLSILSRSVAYDLDLDGRYTYISEVAKDLFGYSPDEMVGKMYFCDICPGTDREEIKQYGREVLKNKTHVKELEHRIQKKNGEIIWVMSHGSFLYDHKNEMIGFRGIDIDISRQKASEEKIKYLSFHDQLTGLYNRRFFEEELQRLDAKRNLPLSILMIDVNGLKLVNDVFGHQAGDELLKKTAKILRRVCREDDVVARVGGDEFMIILPKTPDEDSKNVQARIAEETKKEKVRMLEISLSCGSSTKTDEMLNINEIMILAENKMYEDKNSNKNRNRQRAVDNILQNLFMNIDTEESHARRVSNISVKIGEAMGLNEEELCRIQISGLLHDIGKIAIDQNVLKKNSFLTETEWKSVERHPEISFTILNSLLEYIFSAEDVLHHHERFDGTGYPEGISAYNIPLYSRIIAVADAFEAMTNERPFRLAMTDEEAIEILKDEKGKQFDPDIVDLFIKEKIYKE